MRRESVRDLPREMEQSWLIQRLEVPRQFNFGGVKDNPFSFGGGLRNGGLSDEAMDLIREIWSWDYMGAAEYEWGAVPAALGTIARNIDQYTTWTLTLDVNKDVAKNWREKDETFEGTRDIYVMAPERWKDEINNRLRAWARDDTKEYRVRDNPQINMQLRPVEGWHRDKIGGLELDNAWMFFTNEEAFDKTCQLFGLTDTNEATA